MNMHTIAENDNTRKSNVKGRNMNYQIKDNEKQPAYMQLYASLREDIISGVYKYGDKLPSKRTLSTDAYVSVITAEHAYQLLCDEGYVQSRKRSGYYVIYREADFPEQMQFPSVTDSLSDVVSHCREVDITREHSSSVHQAQSASYTKQPDITSFSDEEFSINIMAKAMRRVLSTKWDNIMIKAPGKGCIELRTEIASYLAKSRGIHADVSQIVIGAGAEYLYSLVSHMLKPGEPVAIEEPSYDKIRRIYELFGHDVIPCRLGNNGILSSYLKNADSRILHVTPFHSYPSQVTADISKKREYIKWAKERDGLIIEDNYDSELTISQKLEDSLFSLADGERVIYINTFSKTISASLRVGYMILPTDIAEFFDSKLGFFSCAVPVFEQLVIAELLKSGDYERHINRIRRRRREKK